MSDAPNIDAATPMVKGGGPVNPCMMHEITAIFAGLHKIGASDVRLGLVA